MIEQKFKIGDVVGLKSDSPDMTVIKDRLGTDLELGDFFDGTYECSWFLKDLEHRKIFPQEALEKRG